MIRNGLHCLTVLFVATLLGASGPAQSLSERADAFAQKANLRPGDLRTAGWVESEARTVVAVSVVGIRQSDSAEVNQARSAMAETAAKLRGALLLEAHHWKFSKEDILLIEAGLGEVVPRSFSGNLPPGVQTRKNSGAGRTWWTIFVPQVGVDEPREAHQKDMQLARTIGLMQRLPDLKGKGDGAAYSAGIQQCSPLVSQLQGAQAASMRQWLLALAFHALAAGDSCQALVLDVFERLKELDNTWNIKELQLVQRMAVAAGDTALAALLAPLANGDLTDIDALARVLRSAMGPNTVPAGQYIARIDSAGAIILVVADDPGMPADGSAPQGPQPKTAAELLDEVLAGKLAIDAMVAAPPTQCVRAKQGTVLSAGIVATGARAEFTYEIAAPTTGAAKPSETPPAPRLRTVAWAVVGAKK